MPDSKVVMKSIFIQIASYQDQELAPTILDCLEKSSKNFDIHFGVCLVYNEGNVDIPNVPNLNFIMRKAPDALGVGKARYLANSLYDGQDYYLQIDSHTRFIQNWDEEIVKCYESYKSRWLNPVITTYPARYWYEGNKLNLDTNLTVTYIDFKDDDPTLFKEKKFLHQIAKPNPLNNVFTKSISGGSVFSDGSIHTIKPNKKMFNWGEEMLYAMRLYTHGYDIMLPKNQYLFHLYYDHNNITGNRRNLSGKDFPELTQQILNQSLDEVSRIVTGNVIGPQELGSKRTLRQYEEYAKISFS